MDKAIYKFISKQTNDPIVERRTCTVSGKEFAIFQSDKEFYEKISPIFNGKKYLIPFPTLCPEERERRRLTWRNEERLYQTKSSLSGKKILTMFNPQQHTNILSHEERFGNQWSGFDYAMDPDISRPFFEQFAKLMTQVPKMNLSVINIHNGPYNNNANGLNRCYLIQNGTNSEDCLYGRTVWYCNKCIDGGNIIHCECCYDCTDCESCFELFNSQRCQSCTQSQYLQDCSNCHHCRNCRELHNASYYIENKQYSSEEYTKIIKNLRNTIPQTFPDVPVQDMHLTQVENVIGNYVTHTKNAFFVFDSFHLEDAKYCLKIIEAKDVMDVSYFGAGLELSYEGTVIGLESSRLFFCADCRDNVHDLWYCYMVCSGSHHCFGCVGLKNASYCIFNKQYSKEKYEHQVAVLIIHMQKTGEWGTFFPPSFSPFAYNETEALIHMPLSKEKVIAGGYIRTDYKHQVDIPKHAITLNPKEYNKKQWKILRDDDTLVDKVFLCEISGQPYRILKQELTFYRKYDLPLPRIHPNERHIQRWQKRTKNTLYLRKCDKCDIEILSVYKKEYKGKVYCEDCYQKEIYG